MWQIANSGQLDMDKVMGSAAAGAATISVVYLLKHGWSGMQAVFEGTDPTDIPNSGIALASQNATTVVEYTDIPTPPALLPVVSTPAGQPVSKGPSVGTTPVKPLSPQPQISDANPGDGEFQKGNFTRDGQGMLFDGTYRVAPYLQGLHTSGGNGKSQFFGGIDVDSMVLEIAEYADQHNLWVKGRVTIKMDRLVGTNSHTGKDTDTVVVQKRNSGIIHGWPK
jgi:hypothetical protein